MGKAYDSEGFEYELDSKDGLDMGKYEKEEKAPIDDGDMMMGGEMGAEDMDVIDVDWKDSPKKCSASFPFSSLEGRLVIFKIGDGDRPASPKDIKDAQRQIEKALKGINCRIMVTHHAFDVVVL